MLGGGADDLFEHFVGKQAQREVEDLTEAELTEEKRRALHKLFTTLPDNGPSLTIEYLDQFEEETGIELSSTVMVLSGFFRGVHMANMEEPEIRTEMLGTRGVCLMAGSSLFGFHDHADGVSYLCNPISHTQARTNRVYTLLTAVFASLTGWEGISTESESSFRVDGTWVDSEKLKTIMQLTSANMLAGAVVEHDVADKFESVKFDMEMRKATGYGED